MRAEFIPTRNGWTRPRKDVNGRPRFVPKRWRENSKKIPTVADIAMRSTANVSDKEQYELG